MTDRSWVDVDAGAAFARPYLIVVSLTFAAGILDASAFAKFGVFTANQAGNLVIGWTLLADDPAAALLALSSVLGCACGVAATVAARRWRPWLAGPGGSRALLAVAAALIVVAAAVAEALAGPGPQPPGNLGSSVWWGQAGSVALSAACLSLLATVFISGGGVRAPILASTNAFVDAVRHGTAAGLDRDGSAWRAQARRAAGFPLAWTMGAALTALLALRYVADAALAAAVIAAVALLSRRVRA